MKFKKYPKNKPTESKNYLCKHPVLLGSGEVVYYYTVQQWSNKWQAWNTSDIYDEADDPLRHAIYDIDGWAEIEDEGYED